MCWNFENRCWVFYMTQSEQTIEWTFWNAGPKQQVNTCTTIAYLNTNLHLSGWWPTMCMSYGWAWEFIHMTKCIQCGCTHKSTFHVNRVTVWRVCLFSSPKINVSHFYCEIPNLWYSQRKKNLSQFCKHYEFSHSHCRQSAKCNRSLMCENALRIVRMIIPFLQWWEGISLTRTIEDFFLLDLFQTWIEKMQISTVVQPEFLSTTPKHQSNQSASIVDFIWRSLRGMMESSLTSSWVC